MKNALCLAVLIGSGLTCLQDAHAACNAQSVVVSSGKVEVAQYEVVSPEIHRLVLPNGFPLGLKIEPAPPEKGDLVKISLYDLRKNKPRRLTYTWGGVNSSQGYGPHGGADRVTAIGEPGVELKLSKPACANSAS